MIKCTICQGRIRPPKRPWTDTPDGFHFYEAGSSMEVYTKWLARLAKRIDMVHEDCYDQADPKPQGVLIAQDFEKRLRWRQQRKRRTV